MIEAVSTAEARSRFAWVVNRAAFGRERIAVVRHGRKLAAIVPYRDLVRLLEMGEEPPRNPEEMFSPEAMRKELERYRARRGWKP